MNVFLGGTCATTKPLHGWRGRLIPMLEVDYYNPVVENWNEEAQKEEDRQKEISDMRLYVITSEMTGVYSIAEVVDDSNKRPFRTVLCVLPEGFSEAQLRSLNAVKKLVAANGGIVFDSLEKTAEFLNKAELVFKLFNVSVDELKSSEE